MFWVKTPALMEQVFRDAWWRLNEDPKTIYLTFDDGPHPETTPFILNELKKHEATATFFCTGKAVSAHPDLFERMAGEGHAVGNHSFSHPHSWKTPSQDYLEDIAKADSVIKSKLFRPPYGKLTRSQWLFLKQQYQVVMWSVMPHDYKAATSHEKILSRLMDHSGPGDIVVLHENDNSKEHIRQVLPVYLTHLADQGLNIKKLPHVD